MHTTQSKAYLEGARRRAKYHERLIPTTVIKRNVEHEVAKIKKAYKDQRITFTTRSIKVLTDLIESMCEKDIRAALNDNGKMVVMDSGAVCKVPSGIVSANHIPTTLWY